MIGIGGEIWHEEGAHEVMNVWMIRGMPFRFMWLMLCYNKSIEH